MLRETLQEQEPARRMTLISILAALVALVITGLGDVPFYHHETRIYFFTLIALAHIHIGRCGMKWACANTITER